MLALLLLWLPAAAVSRLRPKLLLSRPTLLQPLRLKKLLRLLTLPLRLLTLLLRLTLLLLRLTPLLLRLTPLLRLLTLLPLRLASSKLLQSEQKGRPIGRPFFFVLKYFRASGPPCRVSSA